MKYAGMPMGMWALFAGSFQKQLTAVLGYDAATAKQITKSAKPKYKEIIAKLPEFEKADRFQLNIIGCAMLGAFVLCMPKRPDTEALTVYYENAQMTPLMKWFCRRSGKSKFTAKDIASMKATADLKAADRNPYSWNVSKTLAKRERAGRCQPSCGSQLRYNSANICMNADRLSLDLRRANGLPLIDADVECVWIFSGHPPERILDDNRSVVANTQFQKEDALPLVTAQKFTVSLCRTVPSFVLCKGIVCTQVHAHGSAAVRTMRHKLRWDLCLERCGLRYAQ